MVNFSLKSTRTAIAIIGVNVKALVLNILSIMGAAMRSVLMAFLSARALGSGLKTATIFLLNGLRAVIEAAFLITIAVVGKVIELLMRVLIIVMVAACDAITTTMIYAAESLLETIVISMSECSELELELESNLHSNTIKIVNNLEMLRSAVQDIQSSRELLIECPSKD